MTKEFTAVLEDFNNKLWRYHILVPTEIADTFINGKDRRVLCTFNNQLTIQAGLMPNKETYFILINKQIRDQLGLEVGSELKVKLEKDTSTYGLDMPEELRIMFDQEPEAHLFFEELTAGKKRGLIYLVKSVKNTDSRIKKGLAICHHLKESTGNLDYKRLYELIKEYNSKFY